MKKLSKESLTLLIEQGLEADIRNKLGIAKNIPLLFRMYIKERNPSKKERLYCLLNESMKRLEKDVDHICLSLSFFEITPKSPHQ